METIQATVLETTYRNEENGYTVLQARTAKGRVTVVGTLPELATGEQVNFTGQWIEHPQYGRQLKAASCEIMQPTTLLGIERYLGSGLIRGIGPATAKRLVKFFGSDVLDILSEHPERLEEVPKIGAKRSAMIAESYREQMQTRQAMVFLQSYGVPPNLAVKISRLYGERTADVIRDNPYRLIDDVDGVGFMTADRIALTLGVAGDSAFRVRSALKYIVKEANVTSGHVYLPKDEAIRRAGMLLSVDKELVANELQWLLLKREMVQGVGEDGEEALYLPMFDQAEREVARRLLEMLAALPRRKKKGVDKEIATLEKNWDIQFSSQQKEAAKAALESGVLVVTGGPGTGKTTLINCLIRLLSADGEVVLCAPTGRAAKRMTEATGMEAKTIHRLLEYGGEENLFLRNQDNPIEANCLIVDEMSMVDLMLMRSLLRALELGTRLILVGDADQLPSVGAGNVLGDILKSDTIPSVRLTEIFRQEGESRIVVNAHRINEGEMPYLNEKGTDFFFERKSQFGEAARTIVELVSRRLPGFLKFPVGEAAQKIQVLAATKKGDCGVWALNKLLQEALNPPAPNKDFVNYGETIFRVGDKIIQTKNDYQLEWRRKAPAGWEDGTGVFNGDVGFITAVDSQDHTITVLFDEEREAEYQSTQLEDIELAYCLSVHKSQGSEFPVVVMPVVGGPPMLLTRNLFYTALTRARQMVVLVGREDVVATMVQNNHVMKRFTTLKKRLTEMEMLLP